MGYPARVGGHRWSCLLRPKTCPGLGEILLPFSETELNDFQEGWHRCALDSPIGRGKDGSSQGDRKSRAAAPEGTGLPTFLAGQDSKTLFCLYYHPVHHLFCPDNCAVGSSQHQAPRPLSSLPTTTRNGYHWLCFADKETQRGRLEGVEGMIGRSEPCSERLLLGQGLVPRRTPLFPRPTRSISHPGTEERKPWKLLLRDHSNTEPRCE